MKVKKSLISLCIGSADEIKDRAEELFGNKKRFDLALMYDVFNDNSIDQM
jgi:hypothetical protein